MSRLNPTRRLLATFLCMGVLLAVAPAGADSQRPFRRPAATAEVALPTWNEDTAPGILEATAAAREAQDRLRRLWHANPIKEPEPGGYPKHQGQHVLNWRADLDQAERNAILAQERLAWESAGGMTQKDLAALKPAFEQYRAIEKNLRRIGQHDKQAAKLLRQMDETVEYVNGAKKRIAENGMPSSPVDVLIQKDLVVAGFMNMLHLRLLSDKLEVDSALGREKNKIMERLALARETMRGVYEDRVERGIERINGQLEGEAPWGQHARSFSIGRPRSGNKRDLLERELQAMIHELIGGNPLEENAKAAAPTATPVMLQQLTEFYAEVYRDHAAMKAKLGYKTASGTLSTAFEKEGVKWARRYLSSWGGWLYLEWTKKAQRLYNRYMKAFKTTRRTLSSRPNVDADTVQYIDGAMETYRARHREMKRLFDEHIIWTARQAKQMDEVAAGNKAAQSLVDQAEKKAADRAQAIDALAAKPAFKALE